jgi:lipid A 3-O-deacylase
MTRKLFVLLMVFCAFASAQEIPSDSLRKPNWNKGVWVGGGTGLGEEGDGFQFVNAGFRLSRVLMRERGSGRFRGTLEYGFDVMPLYPVHFDRWVYGGGMNPVVLKWNFTSGKRIVPYGELSAGFLIHTQNIPPGDTSQVNFIEGIGGGFQVFRNPKHAWYLGAKVFHMSNASLGRTNPGVNTSLQFTMGYTWFK